MNRWRPPTEEGFALLATLGVMALMVLVVSATAGYALTTTQLDNRRSESFARLRAADGALQSAVVILRSDTTASKGRVGRPCLTATSDTRTITIAAFPVTVVCIPQAVATGQKERKAQLRASVADPDGTIALRASGIIRLIDVDPATASDSPGHSVVIEDWRWCRTTAGECS